MANAVGNVVSSKNSVKRVKVFKLILLMILISCLIRSVQNECISSFYFEAGDKRYGQASIFEGSSAK